MNMNKFSSLAVLLFVMNASDVAAAEKTIEKGLDEHGNQTSSAAESAAEGDGIVIREMVITGTRYETEVLDNPVSLTVIDQQTIQRSGARNIGDLFSHEANIDIGPEGTPWNGKARIRGLYGDRVLILIDGERYNSHVGATYGGAELSTIDIEQVERIEIIRGPSSVLYGSAAVGGVVNIITRKAQIRDEPYTELRAAVSYDSVNQMPKVSAGMNVGDGKMAFNLGASWRSAEGLDTPAGELPHSSFKDSGISLDLKYLISEQESLRLAWQYSLATDVETPPFSMFDPEASIPLEGMPVELIPEGILNSIYGVQIPAWAETTITQPSVERKKFSLAYKIEDPYPWMQQLNASVYLNRVNHDVFMYTNIEPVIEGVTVNIIPQADISMSIDTLGLNIQGMSMLGSKHFITSGLDVFHDKAYGPSQTVTDIIIYNLIPVYTVSVGEDPLNGTLDSVGLYIQDEISLSEKLTAFVGGRYEFFRTNNNPDSDQLAAASSSDDAITGALGLVYRLAPSVSLVANIGTAFRMPTLKERYYYGAGAGGLVMVGNPTLEAEESFNTEFGAKFSSSRLHGDFAVFRNEIDNLILFESIPQGKITFKNLGKAELLGAELNLHYSMRDSWTSFLKMAYTQGEDMKEGDPIEAIPPLGADLGLRYEDQGKFDSLPPFWSELTASVYDHQHRIPSDWTDAGKTSGFSVYNLQAGMDVSKLSLFKDMKTAELRFGIKNLTDKLYTTFPVILFTGDITDRLTQPGRNFQVSLRANW